MKWSWAVLRYYTNIFQEGLKKGMINLIWVSWSPGKVPKPVTS
jgi:hypothetical protein